MKLYMAITADEYELPMGVFGSVIEMAKGYGMTARTVSSYISRGTVRKKDKVKFIRLEVQNDSSSCDM